MVVRRHRGVALFLGRLRARLELVAAFAGVGLVLVALGRLLPFRDDFLRLRTVGVHGHFLGCGAQDGAADGLRLVERPEVGGFDVVADRRRLRRLAQRLGEGEHQR